MHKHFIPFALGIYTGSIYDDWSLRDTFPGEGNVVTSCYIILF